MEELGHGSEDGLRGKGLPPYFQSPHLLSSIVL